MSLREDFASSYWYHAQECGRLAAIEKVAEELGLLNKDVYIVHGTSRYHKGKWSGPYLQLEPRHLMGIGLTTDGRTIDMGVVETTPTLAECARLLLPKVGRFEKSFDENTNEIVLTAEYRGVTIILKDRTPETCTVERIEEEVEIPETVTPAHTEKRVKYALKGDCDPLLSSKSGEENEQEAQAAGA